MLDKRDTLLLSKKFLTWPLLLLDFNRRACIIGPIIFNGHPNLNLSHQGKKGKQNHDHGPYFDYRR